MAEKIGYTNVKVYTAGIPAWKKAKLPVHVSAGWLSKNLDPGTIILDIRQNAKKHIKSAVGFSSAKIKSMGQAYANKKRGKRKGELYSKRVLPGIMDKSAPIVIYGETADAKDVLAAYKELKKWKYKSVAILDQGFPQWKKAGLPTAGGTATAKFNYVKKLVKGAIASADFQSFVKGGGLVLDVRTARETKKGMIKKALHIPLEKLETDFTKLPKDKEIVIHCATGVRASIAYNLLTGKGYKKVRFLNENISIKKSGDYQVN